MQRTKHLDRQIRMWNPERDEELANYAVCLSPDVHQAASAGRFVCAKGQWDVGCHKKSSTRVGKLTQPRGDYQVLVKAGLSLSLQAPI